MKYNSFVQYGYRQLVYKILDDVAKNGLNGGSYFMITFETNRDDVILPAFVKAKYPTEMTIILQHQFENLIATPEKMMVDLTFGGVISTITIPLTAMHTFADPAHEFGVMFEKEDAPLAAESAPVSAPKPNRDNVIDLSTYRRKK